MVEPASLLMIEFLSWVAGRRRTYAEAMEAWRTSCPRHAVWEDALAGGLIQLGGGDTWRESEVTLTPRGEDVLAGNPCQADREGVS
jgi:hypothetical protein